MTSVPIHPSSSAVKSTLSNPLPELLHTPYGLALLEIQGRINYPKEHENLQDSDSSVNLDAQETPIGRLMFPDYSPDTEGISTSWMKRVYLYVGKHQRLTGEVKKLPKAIAIIRKRPAENRDASKDLGGALPGEQTEELEVAEIVKWKIIFSQRPEPVGTTS